MSRIVTATGKDLSGGSRFGGVAWTPLTLGASLFAWWDAETAGSITLSGSNVITWADRIGGLSPTQASTRPTYSATGFNSRPGITFNGTDQFLVVTSTTGLPTGVTPCEIWALVDQTLTAADTNVRVFFGYGNTSAGMSRNVQRLVTTGVNRARAVSGDGAANANSGQPAVDFSGRHVMRGIFTAANVTGEVDATAGTATGVTMNTASTRTTIGSNAAAAGATLFTGVINSILVTDVLSAANAALLYAYLNGRK